MHFHDASEVWGQAPRAVVVSLVQAPAVRRVLSDGLQYAKLAAVAGREVEQLDQWEIYVTGEVRDWITALDDRSHRLVVQAIDLLADRGPALGRPMVDHIQHSAIQNLKELRPASAGRTELRILFAFDPWRSAILLVAGDKSGNWQRWYRQAVPLAEQLLETYLKERAEEEGQG